MKPADIKTLLLVFCVVTPVLFALPVFPGETASGSAPSDSSVEKVYLNTTEITLEWPTPKRSEDIKKYQLWVTTDGGENWKEGPEYTDLKVPHIDYNIKSHLGTTEGDYGFWITKYNRAGMHDIIPQSGMRPRVHVTIDMTPPSLIIKTLNLVVTENEPLRIEWAAGDEHFGEEPISVLVGERRGDVWSYAHAASFPNTGHGEIPLSYPTGNYKLLIRAKDLAGNCRIMTEPLQIVGDEPGADRPRYGITFRKLKPAHNTDEFRIYVMVDPRYFGEVRSLHLKYQREGQEGWTEFPGRAEQLQWFDFKLNRNRAEEGDGEYRFFVFALGKKGQAIAGLPNADQKEMPQGSTLIDTRLPRITSTFDQYEFKGGTSIKVPFKVTEENGKPEVRILSSSGPGQEYAPLPVIINLSDNKSGHDYTGSFEMKLPFGRWRYRLRIEAVDIAKNIATYDFKTIEVTSFRNPPPNEPAKLRSLNEHAETLFKQGLEYMAKRDPRTRTRHLALARNAFERSLAHGPDWPDTHRNLAYVCNQLKDYIAAEKYCKKEIDFYMGTKSEVMLKREIGARINLAKIYFNAKHLRAAQHELELVGRLEHDMDEARIACRMLIVIAKTFETVGKNTEAYEAYSAVLQFKRRPEELEESANEAIGRLKPRAG
ncbi:MAG: tetratricopeptide repeat protein [Planctomycetota bacterium]|jgi:Tfp pilus assembly protein PilF